MNFQVLDKIDKQLQINLNPKRYQHTLGVEETALFIGSKYQLDPLKLSLSAKLHDYAKYYTITELQNYCINNNIEMDNFESGSHGLLHGKVGGYLAGELFGIKDIDVIRSVTSHTTGRPDMSIYEEVIFVSDFCEPNRKLEGSSKIVETALENISEAVFSVVASKISFVIECNGLIHPRSVETYNAYLRKIKDK